MTGYDLVEYPSKPFLQCHPDRLALMGRLFGLQTRSPAAARVLEFGCGDGLSLIAAAIALPQAHFTGIDQSSSAIGRGQEMLRELGLENVHLQQKDLRDLPQEPGQFDYIVAHGLYSWISADARDALLAAIRRLLQPDGIAFVSYNAYPGAYLRQMVREMARMSAGHDISAAREWLAAAPELSTASPVFRHVLIDECANMLRREDGALFHDDLAEVNHPVFFRDFMRHAIGHGLQYVSEADLSSTARCAAGTGRLEAEQAADSANGRRFRQTLLCHREREVAAEPEFAKLKDCFAGGPVSTGVPSLDGKFEYVSRLGGRTITQSVEDRMILESVAAAWPCYVAARDLGRPVFNRLLKLFAEGMIDIRVIPPPVAKYPGARPAASGLARLQARMGMPLTSLHHIEVAAQSASLRDLLPMVDGTKTRAQMARGLRKLYPSEPKEDVALAVDAHLEELQFYGLLLNARNNRRSKLRVTRMGSSGPERKGR